MGPVRHAIAATLHHIDRTSMLRASKKADIDTVLNSPSYSCVIDTDGTFDECSIWNWSLCIVSHGMVTL